jgi:hypothetical protein
LLDDIQRSKESVSFIFVKSNDEKGAPITFATTTTARIINIDFRLFFLRSSHYDLKDFNL